MLMIAGANILAWLMTVERVPHTLARLIQELGGGQAVFVPLAQQLGVDLLHYGIVMTAVMGIALFLPPFGVGLFIVLGIAGCPLRDLARELAPYIVTMLAVALVIAYVPYISFVVPEALGLYRAPGS
jgi:TRAP-type C4-dicarboxylate transport system permease large subunit